MISTTQEMSTFFFFFSSVHVHWVSDSSIETWVPVHSANYKHQKESCSFSSIFDLAEINFQHC